VQSAVCLYVGVCDCVDDGGKCERTEEGDGGTIEAGNRLLGCRSALFLFVLCLFDSGTRVK
jgi:hypothetical protein